MSISFGFDNLTMVEDKMQSHYHPQTHTNSSLSFLSYTMSLFLSPNTSYTFLTIPTCAKPKQWRSPHFITYAEPSARDRVIDFGKYKGRMLGTLPSTYLKWVSNNLRARDFEEWANLADQVLQDPVYNDRVEWEFAEKLLQGNTAGSSIIKSDGGTVSELLEISHRFGWDNEDKVGWSKVDFQLLGTSRGGRIPRVKEEEKEEIAETRKGENAGGDSKRGARRERLKMKRRMKNVNVGGSEGVGSKRGGNDKVFSPFPGRESLVRKVLDGRSNF